MKKAFTVIDLVFALVVIGIILLLIATLTTPRKAAAAAASPPQTPKNFIVLSKESLYSCCHPIIYIVKDSQTEQEYIIVEDSTGVSITPRLKKKEE